MNQMPAITLNLGSWLLICRTIGYLESYVSAKIIEENSGLAKNTRELRKLLEDPNTYEPRPGATPAVAA